MKKTLIYFSVLFVILVGLQLATKVPAAETTKVLRLGNISAWVGSGVLFSKIIVDQSIKPYLLMINNKGGIKVGGETYKLDLVVEDDKYTAAGGRAAAEKLIFKEKVKFLVGNYVAASILAVIPLATENKIIMIVGGYPPFSRPEFPYFFECAPNGRQRMYGVVSVAKKKYPQIKRVAILTPDDETGLDSQNTGAKMSPEFGMEVVYSERHPRNTKDYYPFITKMLVQKPDLVMSGSSPGDFSQIVKQLKEFGYKGELVSTTTLADPKTFMKTAGVEASQRILFWYDDYNHPNVIPRMREFQEFYTKVWKGSSEDVHLTPYITCFEVLVQALEKANTFDPDVVKGVLETSEFDTLLGRVRFEGKETYGIGHRLNGPVRVGEIRGDKVVHVGEATLREP